MFLSVIIIYFCLLMLIAWWTGRRTSESTYFTGDRESPWYLVAFGMIGASISGVTFVSVPGEVGNSCWYYLCLVAGNFVGYQVIAFGLIPLYYRLRVVSIYQFLEQRLGRISHRTGAGFFLLSQFVGATFRLFLVVAALQVFVFDGLGVSIYLTAGITLLMILAYSAKAGIKTIVWTDTLQTLAMLIALLATVVGICEVCEISLGSVFRVVARHETFDIIDEDWHSRTHFVKQFFAGIAMVVVMNGLDQNIMQKNLTCRSARESRSNMICFSVAFVVVNVMFLSLGTLLYYAADELGVGVPARTDELFPLIVRDYLPAGVGVAFLVGIIAAAFSSADSALTALTTVVCVDFLKVEKEGAVRRYVTLIIALLMYLTLCVFSLVNDTSVVNSIFTAAGYTYGPLLGLYAFGLFTKWETRERAVPWICVGSVVLCYVINRLLPALTGYSMGFELIILNGLLVFLGLIITRK